MRLFAPGLAALLRYDRANLRPDVIAGVSIAAVALPVAIAYAELARVPAVMGIYAAIFPLFAYALFGSSRQLVVGPDAATCLMAAAAVGAIGAAGTEHAAELMVLLSLMTGVLYVLAGIVRFGFIANFLSLPILVGYLNGVALIILIGQLPKLCGIAPGGDGFFLQLAALVENLHYAHIPTVILGVGAVAVLFALRRWTPQLPGALIVAILAIAAAAALDLGARGVGLLGAVPAGLPDVGVPSVSARELAEILDDAAGLALIGFASGILTAKSFARRSGYDVDPNRELVAFGAANLASGLAQGFPVTGADSRTAVNVGMGGRTHLAGAVAGVTMLAFLLFLTAPLAFLPKTALAAIIIVATFGLFDFAELRRLWRASYRELAFSLATTVGVLVFGVLPGVLAAVVLSLLWLLLTMARPHDAVLGQPPGVDGLHDIVDYPDAVTIPGLLIYRFDAPVVFFNCDHLKLRVETLVSRAVTPVEWVVIDAGPINVVDYTALGMLDALRRELDSRGIVLVVARARHSLGRFFHFAWMLERQGTDQVLRYPTLESAIAAFERRTPRAKVGGG